MFRITSSRLIRSAAALALGLVAVEAQAAVPHSFRDIEFSMSDKDTPLAAQALAEQLVPNGASVARAGAALRKAGAHQLRAAPNGDLRFVYAITDVSDDLLRDTQIVIRVAQHDGQVASVVAERNSHDG